MKTKVLFLLPYPLHLAPSQRFRVEAYFNYLQQAGIQYQTDVFLNKAAWNILYKKGSLPQKAAAVGMGFLKRLLVVLFQAWRYNYVYVHREASPLGPPVFEWLLAKVFRKKIIYDFDDAIWIPAISENNKLARTVKCFWKVKYICRWAFKVAPGNAFLAAYAQQYNPNVYIVPTCVDTDTRFNQLKTAGNVPPVIGWTGSHSTLKYLDALMPVLQKLERSRNFTFLVICDKNPVLPLANFRFLPWAEASEIEDLLKMDIGVMPLEHDAWSEGKCGFKIIQYLSLGIPAVASPVGVNTIIIEQNKNGFLCNNADAWYKALVTLLDDEALRAGFGTAGRKKIEAQYSIDANAPRFCNLFS